MSYHGSNNNTSNTTRQSGQTSGQQYSPDTPQAPNQQANQQQAAQQYSPDMPPATNPLDIYVPGELNTNVVQQIMDRDGLGGQFEIEDTLSIDTDFKTIDKTFGRQDDYVELHLYNNNNQLIYSEENFTDYEIPEGQDCAPLTRHIDIDPASVLNSRTFRTGQFNLKFNSKVS